VRPPSWKWNDASASSDGAAPPTFVFHRSNKWGSLSERAFDGVSVSNANCISTAAYELTVSQDGLRLNGSDTQDSVPLAFTRAADEACFVGHWVLGSDDYRGHIAAESFGATVSP
jgi:hypothetical protein